MFRPRVIPCLLLRDNGLVKSIQFKDHRYIGDPINAIKIFNDKKADELIFLDINASKENRIPSLEFIKQLGDECNMPFAVGGGIKSIEDIKSIINAGAEKVCINTAAVQNPQFIKEAVEVFGSSTIVVCMDIKKKFLGKKQIYLQNGSKSTGIDPLQFANKMVEMGAGEIMVNSIDHDGTMKGYDIELIEKIAKSIPIPVIALGGAGNMNHMLETAKKAKASALAAGSMFVYHGPRNAVLINLPTRKEVSESFKSVVQV
ncbi:MAG: AglZ/HisF2 family acetamidino modification protein [Bacteroidota bacterium]